MLRDIPPQNLDDALAIVLAPPSIPRASRAAVRAFREYLTASRVDWIGVFDPDRGFGSSAMAILIPGRSALLLLPLAEPERYTAALEKVLRRLAMLRLAFVQSLVEPGIVGKAAALEAAGFWRLTQLIYLERDPTYPWLDPPGDAYTWTAYGPETHARFHAAIEQSYQGSADCPELTALRTIDDAIASHRAGGASGAAYWELLGENGRDVGVLLLAAIAGGQALEVSYMGLAPEARGRGLGAAMLRRALDRARARRAKLLTIVVDERNRAARRLYERLGFRAAATRDAYLLACKADAPRE